MLVAIPDLLTADEIAEMRAALAGADWQDGRATAGHRAQDVKRNLQLPLDHPVAKRLGDLILDRLARTPLFIAATLPLRVLPPRFNRYEGGGAYGDHVDSAIFPIPGTRTHVRSDVSATLFLSEPDDYDGGELIVEDGFGPHGVRLAAGQLITYPGSSLHRVTPVTRGAFAAFFWIQSFVAAAERRRQLFELDSAIQALTADHPEHPSIDRLTNIYHNLLRQWSQTLSGVAPRSLADYERLAAAVLPSETWAHIEDGAGSGRGVQDNRAAFDRWRLLPRALADLGGGHSGVDLVGERHQAPLLVAPVAHGRLAHPEGEVAMVQAATAIGVGLVLSTLSSVTVEEVAAARTAAAASLGVAAALWFQLYLQPRRDDSLALVRRAEQAGCTAIVLTIDAGVKRAGFALPPGVTAANLAGIAPPRHVAAPGGPILFGTPLVEAVPRWDDLAWLRGVTRLPVIVKGMAVGADLDRLVETGADALIASNHGGRVLDGLPAALDLLPAMRDRVAGRLPLLVDGGVRSGTDAVKAICLGARAVLVGRPVLHALAVAGTAGVAHVLHLLRAEVEAAMAQLGCATVADLTPERLLRAPV